MTSPRIDAPFFAYGMFLKGEIAFPAIAPYTERVTSGVVDGSLEERDGVYLLVLGKRGKVHGDLIEFNERSVEAAYHLNRPAPIAGPNVG
jgi:hypothetical protein